MEDEYKQIIKELEEIQARELDRIKTLAKESAEFGNYERVRELLSTDAYALAYEVYKRTSIIRRGLSENLTRATDPKIISILERVVSSFSQDIDKMKEQLVNWENWVDDSMLKLKEENKEKK